MTGIIDYGAGNLKSVCNTLDEIGTSRKLIRTPEAVSYTHLTLPTIYSV